jgi:predicted pyridoxine 5'-phosphate oxidase superfamily flavin-nucleotide-binding protein
MLLTADMKSVIATQRLCFAATVTPDGRPNLSPKGTIRVYNDDTLFFCDLGSPNTRKNLEQNPYMEINVVDILSRRGYRFFGKATVVTSSDVLKIAIGILKAEGEFNYPVAAIVMLKVEKAAPLISPGYMHVHSEWEMRDIYKKLRPELDEEFEENIEEQGPVRGGVRD